MSATPIRVFSIPPKLTAGTVVQAVPFQCVVSPLMSSRLTEVYPTAHASLVLLALTAARSAVFPAVAGAVTCDQAVPFQWSMSGFAPTPLASAFSLPTAQASDPLSALTPDRTAFSPVGGLETTVQLVAASAGLAANTTAAGKAAQIPILNARLMDSMTVPFVRECSVTSTAVATGRFGPEARNPGVQLAFSHRKAVPSRRGPGARSAGSP